MSAFLLRRRLLLGAGAALALAPLRARAGFLDAFTEGFGAGVNDGTASTNASINSALASQRARLATPEFNAGSAQAEAYFRANRLTMDSNRFSVAALRADVQAYRASFSSLQRVPRSNLNYNQAADIASRLMPALARLDETWAHDERLANGQVYLPAQSAVKVNYEGLCLDHLLSAPNSGDYLRLLPLSQVTDEKTAKAMEAITRTAKPYIDRATGYAQVDAKAEMQSLVWALRDMQLGATPKLNSLQRSMLAQLDPEQFGGQRDGWDAIGWQLGEAVGKDVRRNFGGLMDLSNMVSVKSRMDEISRDARTNRAPSGSPYTQIAPGVSAMSVGTGPLKAAAVIANGTPAPAILDLRARVAEAANDSQRVLITGVSRGDTSWRMPGDREIIDILIDEEKQLAAKYALEWLPDGVGRVGLSPKSLAMGRMLAATPLLGNLISAGELASGYQWTEWFKPEGQMEKMNAAETLLAAAGTIPGAGNLARLSKSGVDATLPVLAKASQMVDRAGVLPDVAGAIAGGGADVFAKAYAAWEGRSGDPVVRESAAQMEPVVRQAYQAVMRA